MRCIAITKAGFQCLKRTCQTAKKCSVHLKSQDHLIVKNSRIPGAGLGLYVDAPFTLKNGEPKFIVKYADPGPYNPLMTSKQIDKRYPGDMLAPYVWCNGKKYCFDARKKLSTVARYANACDNPAKKNKYKCNSEINLAGDIVALKSLAKGDEVLVSYGPDYWAA